MSKGLGIGLGVLAVIGILIIWFFSIYNNLIKLDNEVQAQWADVQTTYQKRMDMINNLVKTVEGSANFEKGTLTEVINARANATKTEIDPSNLSQAEIDRYQQAQSSLGGALSRLLLVVEKYPDLKANQNFTNLQISIESMESEILYERQKYNATAKAFNNYSESVPNNFVAAMYSRFDKKGYFNADDNAQNAPEVEFSDFGTGNKSEGNQNGEGSSNSGNSQNNAPQPGESNAPKAGEKSNAPKAPVAQPQ